MSVKYDMRKLEQPVTMNGNPFIVEKEARPSLAPVDGYSAMVSSFRSAVATPGPGPNQTQTQSTTSGSNDAQTQAFKKIGGDHSLTITDVQLDTESMGINIIFGLTSGIKISSFGKVQRIDQVAVAGKEMAQ